MFNTLLESTLNSQLSDGVLFFCKYFVLFLMYIFVICAVKSIIVSFPSKSTLKAYKTTVAKTTKNPNLLANSTVLDNKAGQDLTYPLGQTISAPENKRPRDTVDLMLPTEPKGLEQDSFALRDMPTTESMAVGNNYPGYLEVVAGLDSATKRIPIDGVLFFGRSKECTVRLPDLFISSVHAKLTPTAKGVVLEDLNSRNGTFIGEMRITSPRVLRDRDTFVIGECIFRYHLR